ncbi:hypothetical protein HAX54_001616, partial [Datura stramonium]|nr:hypothetical protein [Datura stramonium]
RAITPMNPIGEAETNWIQRLMKESPPKVGNSSVVGKYRGGRRENKRPRAGDLEVSQQGSRRGNHSQ